MPAMTLEQALEQAMRHHQQGRLAEAESIYRQILGHAPNHARATQMLGMLAHQRGRSEEGIGLLKRAIELDPGAADGYGNLGVVLASTGRLAEAADALRQSLALQSNIPETHNNLGNVLKDQGLLEDAIAAYRQALALRPAYASAIYNLGSALLEAGKSEEAASALRQALVVRPEDPDTWNNLGNALSALGRRDEAIEAFQKALSLRPDYAEPQNNLAGVYQDTGRVPEAIAHYRRSLVIKPDPRVASNLALAVHLYPDDDPQRILDEQRAWDVQYGQPLATFMRPHDNDPNPDRRLRIGYVSPDFDSHPVGRFMLPLLQNHDRHGFEIICYSDVKRADEMTSRLRAAAEVWRETAKLPDEALSERIRHDRVDVLVDLALHTKRNRLPVFARKPAPVQITYLAYCSTSGLAAMDYRLTDRFLDPADVDDRFYSEQSVRLPGSYYCFAPPPEAPQLVSPPSIQSGYVTFGSLNKFAKVTPRMLAVWAELMAKTPNSRLVLYCPSGSHRQRVNAVFESHGVARDRLTLVESMPFLKYLEQYNQIDIALDTFPYPGATTTCDALWMGVPTVSLAGRTSLSRAGSSILSHLGLPELVARTPERYIAIAAELAADVPRLSQLRASLRDRMKSSALLDAPGLARGIEQAYRYAWRQWVRGR